MEEIQVPPYFLCPISLEIMKDPVTVSTGITYDRENIEKWIFSGKNNTCPVTKQGIMDGDVGELTPNIILRRYIQSWCTLHAAHGIERFPTPKPPVSRSQIAKLLSDAQSPQMQAECLQRLRSIASESEANRRCIESAGAAAFLASIIINNNNSDEALSLLHNLRLSEQSLKSLAGQDNRFIESLVRSMQTENYESRAFAVMLLKSILKVAEPLQLTGLKPAFYLATVQILKDSISEKASKAALHILINVAPWARNRIKAVEAGATAVLIDLLIESTEKRTCEMILTSLDQLCQCAEGRAELLSHPAGLAVVSKKIFRVSHAASDRAVKILYSISRFSATAAVVHEMLQLGVAAKLCLVTQVDCGSKTKERAMGILKLHAKSWKNSPCIPMNLASSYPSS
ncbi:PREDICTED: E3 ubiquitin-protein ligase PUB23-like [Ipomoea nil]|uniref:E3 ubiquitin-protein ligase PUB23-like n=1 Tax=Ipomoea nil TaxID=35883 RepID=UPI000901BAC8|nr:PREDICTED: E3 ubiquitin-protein ligase PUB23-like [Ipomoea nil]